MKKYIKVIIILITLIGSFVFLAYSYYKFQLSPIGTVDNTVKIEIPKNASGSQIASILEDNELIKNKNFFKLYLKLNNINNLKHGVYNLHQGMGVKNIIDILIIGTTLTGNEIDILFREGINIRQVARAIGNNTTNTEQQVFELLKNQKYIDGLIEDYWFLTEEIKNKELYYPLEGYLSPNTYRFENENVSIEKIFRAMLNEMDKNLSFVRKEIEASNFTVHEFLTLASIVESEGVNDDDRPKIAGVFYNRLSASWSFGSCVTACYAGKEDNCIPENVPTKIDNPYNTYLPSMAGKLPVGPVSIPSKASIMATVNPVDHKYYYFIADKYKNTYFFDINETGRNKKINELKQKKIYPGY